MSEKSNILTINVKATEIDEIKDIIVIIKDIQ